MHGYDYKQVFLRSKVFALSAKSHLICEFQTRSGSADKTMTTDESLTQHLVSFNRSNRK